MCSCSPQVRLSGGESFHVVTAIRRTRLRIRSHCRVYREKFRVSRCLARGAASVGHVCTRDLGLIVIDGPQRTLSQSIVNSKLAFRTLFGKSRQREPPSVPR